MLFGGIIPLFCHFAEFLGDGLNVDAEQFSHCFLCHPECLVSIVDIDTYIAVLVLIEYDAVLIFLYFVFLHYSFAKLHISHMFWWRGVEYIYSKFIMLECFITINDQLNPDFRLPRFWGRTVLWWQRGGFRLGRRSL